MPRDPGELDWQISGKIAYAVLGQGRLQTPEGLCFDIREIHTFRLCLHRDTPRG
jgi:hypothetical protein